MVLEILILIVQILSVYSYILSISHTKYCFLCFSSLETDGEAQVNLTFHGFVTNQKKTLLNWLLEFPC